MDFRTLVNWDRTDLELNEVAFFVFDLYLKVKSDLQFVLGEIDQASLRDLILEDRPRIHLDLRVCHVEHCINLLGQDNEHEDVDDQGEPCPKPCLVSLAALIAE